MTTTARGDPSGSQCRSNSVKPSDVGNVDEVRRIRGIVPGRRTAQQAGTGSRVSWQFVVRSGWFTGAGRAARGGAGPQFVQSESARPEGRTCASILGALRTTSFELQPPQPLRSR